MTDQKHPRGLSDRLMTSGLLQVFGLDLLLLVAVAAIGVSVYRLLPDLVWGYAGALCLAAWWAIGRSKAPKAN